MEEALSAPREAWLGEIERVYGARGERGDYVVLEGRNLVDACLHRGGRLRALVLTGQSHGDLENEVEGDVEIIRVDQERARKLTGFPFHRGVLGIADRPEMVPLDVLIDTLPAGGLLVVCPGLGDPGNLGAIVRCAAAFGAAGVVVGKGGPDVFGRKAMRGSAGGIFTVRIAECQALPSEIPKMKRAGIEIVGADGRIDSAESVDEYLPAASGRVALVLGNEGHGLADEIISQCDKIVRINISPAVESLNAACAAAVLLHAIRGKGQREPGSWSA